MNNSMVSPSIVIEAIGDFASQRDSVEIPSDPVMSDSFECTIVPPAAACGPGDITRKLVAVATSSPTTTPSADASRFRANRARPPVIDPVVAFVALFSFSLNMPPLYEHLDLKSTDI